MNLDILYEDANILILNKEVGMLSQKAKKEDISIIAKIENQEGVDNIDEILDALNDFDVRSRMNAGNETN